MVSYFSRLHTDAAMRNRALWYLVGWGVCGVFLVIGAGYAVGGNHAISSQVLQLLLNLENPIGGLHAHGFIMMLLALFLVYAMGIGPERRRTRLALRLMALYSLIVAILIFAGWTLYPVSFGAPWWYVLTAFLSLVLINFTPPSIPPPDDGRGERA